MKVYFRPQRGGFKEAMDEKRQFKKMEEVKIQIADEYNVDINKVNIEYTCFDGRLPADSFVVTVNGMGVGFAWMEDG